MVKNSPANADDARDAGSISESGRSPGEGNVNPHQYCCLENPRDRGAWQKETNNNRTSGSASTLGCTWPNVSYSRNKLYLLLTWNTGRWPHRTHAHTDTHTHTHTHTQGQVTCKNPYSKARRHGVVWHGTPRRVKREVFVDGLQRMRSIYEPHVGQKPAMDSCYRPWPSLPAFLSGHQ